MGIIDAICRETDSIGLFWSQSPLKTPESVSIKSSSTVSPTVSGFIIDC